MIIDGQVYRDGEHHKWCLCDECVKKDVLKKSFVESYENTFGKRPETVTEDEMDADQSDDHRANND